VFIEWLRRWTRPARVAYYRALRRRRTRRWAELRETGLPVGFVTPGGPSVSLFPIGQIPELLYCSGFERLERLFCSRYLRPGMSVVDVGANVGLYTVLADQLVRPEGRVYAFEPSTESRTVLLRNLELNEATGVEVFGCALSDKAGRAVLQGVDGEGDGFRHLRPRADGVAPVGTGHESVEVATLDEWAAADPVRQMPVDFMKIDVEGGEYAVLRGATLLLARSPDVVVMFESWPEYCARYGHTPSDVHGFLRDTGRQLCYWDLQTKRWSTDKEGLLRSAIVFACRDSTMLPRL